MKIKALKSVFASGVPIKSGTIADVSREDASTLIRMGMALPAGGDDPAAIDNREKDIEVITREERQEAEEEAAERYRCPECEREYTMLHHYRRHMANKHGVVV